MDSRPVVVRQLVGQHVIQNCGYVEKDLLNVNYWELQGQNNPNANYKICKISEMNSKMIYLCQKRL